MRKKAPLTALPKKEKEPTMAEGADMPNVGKNLKAAMKMKAFKKKAKAKKGY